ncbi:hypothetical protein LCGC14_0514370 [marine sediment metagenome]|uniref:Uncharacterized protein n=1 Tax=marine sediment metagenome TaxID=412755 RepID=A0A0F9V8F1_9ZZZZ
MKPNAKQLKEFEALLDEAKCATCKGSGGWRTKTKGVECPVCGGTGQKPGYEIALIDLNAELPDTIPKLCVVNLTEGRGYPKCLDGYARVVKRL